MEQSPSWQSLPPDSAERSALLIFFASLVCVYVGLFGEQLPALCLGFSAGCSLILAGCLRLQRSTRAGTGFSLDDDARTVNPHGARPIPFRSISSFRLTLYRDLASVHVATGRLRRHRLLACVSRPGPVQDILQALSERSVAVKIHRSPFRKRTADILPLVIMPLLAAAALYVNVDMLRRFPGLAVPPQLLSVEACPARAQEELHQLGPVSLLLPRGFRMLNRQGQAALFHSLQDDVRLAIDAAPARATVPHRLLLQAVAGLLGFGNSYDAARLAVRSRFGLMPFLIKSALLKHYEAGTVQIYSVSAGTLSGVMLRGEQNRPGEDGPEHMPDQVAEIMLRDAKKDLVIRVLIASPLPIDTRFIKRLIAGIH